MERERRSRPGFWAKGVAALLLAIMAVAGLARAQSVTAGRLCVGADDRLYAFDY
jgi:hypothetical protein